MKYALSLVLVLATSGCKKEVSALVNCEVTSGPAVECAVKQTKGTAKVEVCWDFRVTCASGATLEAERTCVNVKDGGATNVTIPAEKIKVTGACDGDKSAAIGNMTIDGEQVQAQ